MTFSGLWGLANEEELPAGSIRGVELPAFYAFEKSQFKNCRGIRIDHVQGSMGRAGASCGWTRKMKFPGRRELANQKANGRFAVSGFRRSTFSESCKIKKRRGVSIDHARGFMGHGGASCGGVQRMKFPGRWKLANEVAKGRLALPRFQVFYIFEKS